MGLSLNIVNRNTWKHSADSEEYLLENTIFVVYHPIVNVRKQGQAAGKSVTNCR